MQPERMSIPTTCSRYALGQFPNALVLCLSLLLSLWVWGWWVSRGACARGTDQVHSDWMFYLLYYDDSPLMRQIIGTCVGNIGRQHPTPGVREALATLGDTARDSVHVLRSKLLLLLDQDEASRRHLCEFQPKTARMPRALCPTKASRFYTDLHAEVIPGWIADERVPIATLVDRARMAYLIA